MLMKQQIIIPFNARNLIENKLNSLSDTAKSNTITKNTIDTIKNIDTNSIIGYHNGVEAALAPIFRQMTKKIIDMYPPYWFCPVKRVHIIVGRFCFYFFLNYYYILTRLPPVVTLKSTT